MADIQSAAQWIATLLAEEAKFLYKIEGRVKELQDELEWMQCFLKAADACQFDNVLARKWVAQIREFSYEAEDTIEKFLVRVKPHSGGRADLLSMVKKYSRVLWEIKLVHDIGSNIGKLKDKISSLSSKLNTYGINLRLEESLSLGLSNWKNELSSYYNVQEERIIGRKNDVDELVRELTNPGGHPVVAICGKGGVGKTFLAKEIFHHPTIRRNFDAFAWAYVSKPCQIASLMQRLLSNLTSKSFEQITQLTEDELKDGLYRAALRTRCLIVLDGVWGDKVCHDLKPAFPIANLGFRGKLLLTTQTKQVAKPVDENVKVHSLEPLTKDQSKLLIEEKIKHVQSRFSVKKAGVAGGLLERMRELFGSGKAQKLLDKMLRLCDNLPLLIVLLGGVLANKRSLGEWEIVDKRIDSYLVEHHEQQQRWKCILELSYYDLPYQLKPCFLYLGYFPTNLQLPTRKITNLWEAEGLVSSTLDDETGETHQGIAEHCLAELVDRSLVKAGSRGLSGKAKTCQLHGLVQELCLSKASKGNWLNIVELGADREHEELLGAASSSHAKSSQPPKSAKSAKRKYRRLAIYCSETLTKLPSDYRHAKYIRSLLFFNTLKGEDVLIPMRRKALTKAFTDFKLLRVLDIEDIQVSSLPKEAGFLIHLKYLSLKGSWVSKLPHTIKYLRCLQTLDLRVLSFVCLRIPDVLHRLERLVHLYLPSNTFKVRDNKERLQLKGLRSLETLSNFSITKCIADDLQSLPNLKKFTSHEFLQQTEHVKGILESTSFALGHLEHIVLRLDGKILEKEGTLVGNCEQLRKLYVKGNIGKPIGSIALPPNLVQLTFHGSKFQEDPMPVLEKLAKLKRLSLEHASYEGEKLHCSQQGFKELDYLTLKGLEKLEEWEVKYGAMPKLHRLEINRCWKLKKIPDGLRYIESLQELEISCMLLSFFHGWIPDPGNSREKWLDFEKVRHVPFVKISHVLEIDAKRQESGVFNYIA